MSTDRPFDADAYRKGGNCPWTFFAFPTSLADDEGLPRDDEARRLLTALQSQGIQVGVWIATPVEGMSYFACPKEEIELVNRAITELEDRGDFEKGFCRKRTEFLFSLVGKNI